MKFFTQRTDDMESVHYMAQATKENEENSGGGSRFDKFEDIGFDLAVSRRVIQNTPGFVVAGVPSQTLHKMEMSDIRISQFIFDAAQVILRTRPILFVAPFANEPE